MSFLTTLRRALAAPPLDTELLTARVQGLEAHSRALYDETAELRTELRRALAELQQLRQDEARRAAEHATMVDQLSRLYKRVSARIAREDTPPPPNGAAPHQESVMELRRRLGR